MIRQRKSFKWISLMLSIIMVVGMCISLNVPAFAAEKAQSSSIVNNGDMEGVDNTGGAYWWYNQGSCKLTAVTDTKHDGSHGLKVTGRTQGWEGPAQNLVGNQKPAPVAGKKYHGSAWVMYNGDQAPASVTFKLSVKRQNATETKYDGIQQLSVSKGQWTKLEGDYTLPADTKVDSGVHLYVETTGETAPLIDYYVDDISLIDMSEDQSSVTILSTDFEDKTKGGWLSRGDETVDVTSDVKHDGTYSLAVTKRTQTWNGPKHDLLGVVKPGGQYHISAYVFYKDGPDSMPINMSIQKTSGADTTYPNITSVTAKKGVWTLIEGDYTVPMDSSLTALALYFETAYKTTPAADDLLNFYIDDVKVVGGSPFDYDSTLPGLKSVLNKYFPIGASVVPEQLDSPVLGAFLKNNFALLSPGNCMKPDALQKTEGTFTYGDADKTAQFAKDNGLKMRFHTLLWHSQIPDWFFTDPKDSTKPASSALLLQRMKTHIETVMTHFETKFPGLFYTYDVTNEVLSDAGGLRGDNPGDNSKWKGIVGDVDKDGVADDYIIQAFQTAYTTAKKNGDNKVKFCINDYSLESNPKKVDAMCTEVKRILAKTGIPKDRLVVGLQMHVSIYSPDMSQIKYAVEKLGALGVKLQVTEMDMSIYASSSEPQKTPSEGTLLLQAKRYKALFDYFKEQAQKGVIENVTLWGVCDADSWLNDFPVKGRADAPMLFDRRLKAKPAYWAVVDSSKLAVYRQPLYAVKGTPVLGKNIDQQWLMIKPSTVEQFVVGTKGATAKVKTMWDNKNLYVLAQVEDKTPNAKDGIEIFIDKNYDKSKTYQSDDKCYNVINGKSSGNVSTVYTKSASGYTVQMAIPIADITPAQGKVMGIDFRVTDDQGKGKKAIAVWNDYTNKLDKDTSAFGDLTLDKPVKYITAYKGTPKVDGVVDSIWNGVEAADTSVWVQGTSGSTASFKTLWDKDYLYVLADVKDDKLSKASTNPYEQDSVEIFIDQNNGKTAFYEPDDFQYRVNYENKATFDHGTPPAGFKSAAVKTDTGYRVEAAIPLSQIKGADGQVMGFDLQINNDQDGDGKRDSVSTWCDPSGLTYQNMSALGNVLMKTSK